jgi:DNA-binding CsgD family transcriptional regulator
MTQVFTVEQIAACERDGHRWQLVPCWGGAAWNECTRCGASGRFSPPTDPRTIEVSDGLELPVRPAETGDEVFRVETPLPATGNACPVAGNARPTICDSEIRTRLDHPPQPRRRPGAPRGPRGGLSPRDAEIVQRRGAGATLQAIADLFGIHLTRVAQVLRRARAIAERDATTLKAIADQRDIHRRGWLAHDHGT